MNSRTARLLALLLLAPLAALAFEPSPVAHPAVADAPAGLTPEEGLARLREGNARWVAGRIGPRDHLADIRATGHAQRPFATIVGCMDSRVSTELVFDQGVGDVFGIRVAGNIINDDVLGSLEYAHVVTGSRLLVVLGHSHCGAVKGAADDVKLGHLTGLLARLRPAIAAVPDDGTPRNSTNPVFVDKVARENVALSIREILARSPLLRGLHDSGRIGLVGALYDVETGRVEFFQATPSAAAASINTD